MMGRLRSTTQTLAATAAIVCALSLAGPSPSHAAQPNASKADDASRPCNDICKAYMAWSDRVAAMLHPSSTVARAAVRDGKPAGQMVHPRASRTPQPGLNSFARFPVRRDATAQSVDTEQALVAPSRPADEIADRFPTTAGFVSAVLAGTAGVTSDAPESPVVSITDTISVAPETPTIDDKAEGRDMRIAVSVFLALCILSAVLVRGWFRGRTQRAMR